MRRDATRLRGHARETAAPQGRTWLSDSVPPKMMGSALHPPASPAYSVIGRCCARRLVCIGEHIKRSSVSTEAICACNRASSACSISQRAGRGSGELPRTVIARSAHAETITTANCAPSSHSGCMGRPSLKYPGVRCVRVGKFLTKPNAPIGGSWPWPSGSVTNPQATYYCFACKLCDADLVDVR